MYMYVLWWYVIPMMVLWIITVFEWYDKKHGIERDFWVTSPGLCFLISFVPIINYMFILWRIAVFIAAVFSTIDTPKMVCYLNKIVEFLDTKIFK